MERFLNGDAAIDCAVFFSDCDAKVSRYPDALVPHYAGECACGRIALNGRLVRGAECGHLGSNIQKAISHPGFLLGIAPLPSGDPHRSVLHFCAEGLPGNQPRTPIADPSSRASYGVKLTLGLNKIVDLN